jgi:type II secretory pathway pseudopilin PulG
MDYLNPVTVGLALVIVALLAVIGTRWASRQAPSKVEQSAEEAAFSACEKAIEMLADKSGEQQEIAAAQARMAMKDKLLAQAAQKLAAKLPQSPAAQ